MTSSYKRAGSEIDPAIRTRVVTTSGQHAVAGALFGGTGRNRDGRITEINGFRIEAIPHGHMLVTRNHVVPDENG